MENGEVFILVTFSNFLQEVGKFLSLPNKINSKAICETKNIQIFKPGLYWTIILLLYGIWLVVKEAAKNEYVHS